MPTRPITGPLTRSPSGGVTGVGGGAAWAAALPALRTFITANYNQPNPHNQAVMASPPTITAATTAPSGLTSAYRYSSGGEALTYYGGRDLAFAAYRRFPVATIAATGGNTGNGTQATAWRVQFVADAQKVGFRLLGGTSPYRFIVDGRYVDTAGTTTATSSGTNYITLDFGSKASRSITIESEQANAFDGINLAPGDTISAVASGAKRMIVLGDSFTEGAGAARQGDGFGLVTGDMLGVRDTWDSGVGSTGYVATSSGTRYKLSQRLTDANSYGPWDVIVVGMGVNDIGQAGIQVEAEACIASLRAANPAAQVFVLGPWDVNAPAAPVANYATCKSAIQAAVSARGGVSAGIHFLDPQGVSFTKADAVHPDTAGHKTLGDWLALQVKTALGA